MMREHRLGCRASGSGKCSQAVCHPDAVAIRTPEEEALVVRHLRVGILAQVPHVRRPAKGPRERQRAGRRATLDQDELVVGRETQLVDHLTDAAALAHAVRHQHESGAMVDWLQGRPVAASVARTPASAARAVATTTRPTW